MSDARASSSSSNSTSPAAWSRVNWCSAIASAAAGVFATCKVVLTVAVLVPVPLGNRRGGEPGEFELLERDRAVRVGQRQALVVLHELLHDPLGGGLVALDDVDGDRGQADLSRGERAALSRPDEHAALRVAASTDRRQDAVRPDALHELPVEVRAGAHVLLDDERVRVQVLDDPDGTGGVLGNCHVCSLFHSFFCREGVFTP